MISLEFLNINPDYRSFVRVDSFSRYSLVVLNQHLIMCTPKDYDLKQYGGSNQFEHLTEEVLWKLPSHDYFHSVYLYNKVKDLGLKDIYDVALDLTSMYFLCREGQENSVWRLRIENIVREVGSKEPLVTKIFARLPPSTRLLALAPDTDSDLLLLSNNLAIFLPNPNTQLQPCEVEFSLTVLAKVQVMSRTIVYLSDNKQILSLEVLPERLEVKQIFASKPNLVDFSMAVPGKFENTMSIMLTSSKVLLRRPGAT
jgi:hypothetical protein